MIVLLAVCVISIMVFLFLRLPQFGKIPTGAYASRIRRSPQYSNGKFNNLTPTPDLTDGATYARVMKDFLFKKSKRNRPPGILPSIKTDLQKNSGDNFLVWMGHSSYFMRLDGKNILVDPVFSGHASPVSFTTKSFRGSDIYATEDMPPIDYLFISHDHWDHLDYNTVCKLKQGVKKIITSLGVSAHLMRWGFDPERIIEEDWYQTINLGDGFEVTMAPARHFSGRTFKRNQSLWSSFILKTPSLKIYMGGDSGYDTHFAEIGKMHGPFHLALLECGQYNRYWKYIHMMPEEVVQAARDLQADHLMIVHWAKFSLSLHAWDEPIRRVYEECHKRNLPLIHPMIGESVSLKNMKPGTEWWKTVT